MMQFTKKKNVIKRTTFDTLKNNSNSTYSIINKKTSISFAFNPDSKVGVFYAELGKIQPVQNKADKTHEEKSREKDPGFLIYAGTPNTMNLQHIHGKSGVLTNQNNSQDPNKENTLTRPHTSSSSSSKHTTTQPRQRRVHDQVTQDLHEMVASYQQYNSRIPFSGSTNTRPSTTTIESMKQLNAMRELTNHYVQQKKERDKAAQPGILETSHLDVDPVDKQNILQEITRSVNQVREDMKREIQEVVNKIQALRTEPVQNPEVVQKQVLDNCILQIKDHIKEQRLSEIRDIETSIKTQFDEYFHVTDSVTGKTVIETQVEDIVERTIKQLNDQDTISSPNSHKSMDEDDDVSLGDMSVRYEQIYGSGASQSNNSIQQSIMNSRKSINPQAESNVSHIDEMNMGDLYGGHAGASVSSSSSSTSSFGNMIHYDNNALRALTDKKWIPFGKGIADTVMDMYVEPLTQKLYITGLFQYADDTPVQNIAAYDIQSKTWTSMGEGINNLGVCLAMDVENRILYVGGIFSAVGGTPGKPVNNIVGYNLKSGIWESLGEGLNSECSVLSYNPANKKLYVGGNFTKIGDQDISYVGVYDTQAKTWSALSENTLNGPCKAICLDDTVQELFVGGIFTEVGDYIIYYVASVNLVTGEWSELSGGLRGHCNCMCLHPSHKKLYVGGTFQSVGDIDNAVEAHHIAEFDLETRIWDGMAGGVNGICQTMMYNRQENTLFVGGSFTEIMHDKTKVNYIVKYDTIQKKWSPLDNYFDPRNEPSTPMIGFDGPCKTIAMDDKSMYFGGGFSQSGTSSAKSIVRYLTTRMKI
jgi:hypothetical protein